MAEGALICCRIVLSRCPVQHPELVHKLIQRLAPAAGIPREAASEEVPCALLPCCCRATRRMTVAVRSDIEQHCSTYWGAFVLSHLLQQPL